MSIVRTLAMIFLSLLAGVVCGPRDAGRPEAHALGLGDWVPYIYK